MSETTPSELVEESRVEALPVAQEGDFQYDQRFLSRVLEGAILASGEAVSLDKLLTLFDEDKRPSKSLLTSTLESIRDSQHDRGFVLKQVASGWRFEVCDDLAPWVNRLWDERPQKYSRALLETIALVAYRQPLTRGDIEDVRGVAVSSHIIKTLLERDWVKVVGHRDVPGRPALYATTRQFLDYFGLKSLDELPSLGELQDIDSLSEKLELDGGVSESVESEPSNTDDTSAEIAKAQDDVNQEPVIDASLDGSPALESEPEIDLLGDIVHPAVEGDNADAVENAADDNADDNSALSEDEDNTILSAADSTEPPKNTEV
ncbi:SMC-Scp complex subunit ScpB [Marinagarivorans cellulosilyticus]|uniref:Segregation and condensation protein B n=1 Tax=Marinagarivorans cellulosilyticus TaxID=2721545 RepID=A0AAN2BL57_9GAMM|nr:SMC-Scp complex subunit ScpB [Marinagarivorans cellulosilyticus]BCD98778.1 segregation and condensation protein B [Marinagarivorans cellulosilyticus]